MIYLFLGPDTFSQKEALDELKMAIGIPEVRDANIASLLPVGLTLSHLVSACQTMPFLAERRLVVVEGLLALLGGSARRPGARADQRHDSVSPQDWEALPEHLQQLPPTTDLVFLEVSLNPASALVNRIKGIAVVRQFSLLGGERLLQWIAERATQKGLKLTFGAQRMLQELVGPDLWALNGELEKLALFAEDEPITERDVQLLVSPAREVTVFAAVDAILERHATLAMQRVHNLLEEGLTASYLLAMLSRQTRLALLAQELFRSSTPNDELGRRLSITSAFPLRKTLEQAQRYPPEGLVWLHAKLLETDIAIKTGSLDEQTALAILVAEACQPATIAGPSR